MHYIRCGRIACNSHLQKIRYLIAFILLSLSCWNSVIWGEDCPQFQSFIPFGEVTCLGSSGNTVIANLTRAYLIVDMSNSADPRILGQFFLPDPAVKIVFDKKYVYIVSMYYRGLYIVDLADPSAPVILSNYSVPDTELRSVAISNNRAFIAADNQGLIILDVSDPSQPIEIGNFKPQYCHFYDIALKDTCALIADHGSNSILHVVDVSDPASPFERSYLEDHAISPPTSICISDNKAIISFYGSEIFILDISNLDNVHSIAKYETQSAFPMNNLTLKGDYLFGIVSYHGLWVVDFSQPTKPIEHEYSAYSAYNLSLDSDRAYVASWSEGILKIDSKYPTDLSLEASYGLISSTASEIIVRGENAYVAGGGFRIYSLENPNKPVELGVLHFDRSVRDLVIKGNYAFLANDWEGLVAIDISDPSLPIEVWRFSTWGYGWATRVTINGNYLYLTVRDFDPWTYVFDIQNPVAPVLLSDPFPGIAPVGMVFAGHYAYGIEIFSGAHIMDFSDPVHPIDLGSLEYGEDANGFFVDEDYLYVTVSYGILIYSISDQAHPKLIGLGEAWGARKIIVTRNLAFIAGDGLKILDVSDPRSPHIVGESAVGGEMNSMGMNEEAVIVYDWATGLKIYDITACEVGQHQRPLGRP